MGRVQQRLGRWKARDWLQLACCGAPVVVFVALGWVHRWTFDDGFIYLRIVHNVVHGHGPVYNVGERVEAFTSPLWLAIVSVGDVLSPLRLEWTAAFLGLVFSALGLAALGWGAARVVRTFEPDAFLVPIGLLLPMAIAVTWFYETSGLETGLTLAWLGASFVVLAGWSRGSRMSLPGAVLIGLGWLVRPELVLVSAIFLVIVIAGEWRSEGVRRRALVIVCAGALPFAYEVFRMGYYGLLVANTAIAKEGGSLRVGRGFDYLRDFLDPYGLTWLLLFVAVAAYLPLLWRTARLESRRPLLVVVAFLGAGLIQAAYVVAIGGDYIHGRLLLSALYLVSAPIAVVPLTRRFVASLVVVPWAVVCAVALRPPEYNLGARGGGFQSLFANTRGADPIVFPHADGRVTAISFGWAPGNLPNGYGGERAIFLAKDALGTTWVAIGEQPAAGERVPLVLLDGIGIVGYAHPEVRVVDLLGLANPIGSHFALAYRGFTGHEKPMPAPWAAALVAAPGQPLDAQDFRVGNSWYSLFTSGRGAVFDRQVADARAALRCDPLADVLRAAQAPLTAHRFIDNFLGAWHRTKLRIPPDPAQADARFCRSRSVSQRGARP